MSFFEMEIFQLVERFQGFPRICYLGALLMGPVFLRVESRLPARSFLSAAGGFRRDRLTKVVPPEISINRSQKF